MTIRIDYPSIQTEIKPSTFLPHNSCPEDRKACLQTKRNTGETADSASRACLDLECSISLSALNVEIRIAISFHKMFVEGKQDHAKGILFFIRNNAKNERTKEDKNT